MEFTSVGRCWQRWQRWQGWGDNVVANAGQPDPPFTRAGSQDDVSYTNSLNKLTLYERDLF